MDLDAIERIFVCEGCRPSQAILVHLDRSGGVADSGQRWHQVQKVWNEALLRFSSKVFVLADVQIDVERFAIAVSRRRKDVLVEGAVHANGCAKKKDIHQ